MSRSRRKTPILGNANAASDKPFKADEHKRARSQAKQAIAQGKEPQDIRLYGDPWESPKDGKRYRHDADAKDLRK